MDLFKHLPSLIAASLSEALPFDAQAGCWIFVSGQVGVPLPPTRVPTPRSNRMCVRRSSASGALYDKSGSAGLHLAGIQRPC